MSEARADTAPTLDALRQKLALLTGRANKGRRKRLKQKIERLDWEESLEEAERDRLKDVQKQRRKLHQQPQGLRRKNDTLLRAEEWVACGLPRASDMCRAAQQPEYETKEREQVFTFSEFVARAIREEAVYALQEKERCNLGLELGDKRLSHLYTHTHTSAHMGEEDSEACLKHFAIPEDSTRIYGERWHESDPRNPFSKFTIMRAKAQHVARKDGSWKSWDVDKRTVSSVAIPTSVTRIGEGAFEGCVALTSLPIPTSVTRIGKRAFAGCSLLRNVAIPTSVASMGEDVFRRCYSLESVDIPESVASIGAYAFHQCYSLRHVEIPTSITSISASAFGECFSLTSVTISLSVTTLGGTDLRGTFQPAFKRCASLQILMIRPNDANDAKDDDGTATATAAATTDAVSATATIITAFNEQIEFRAVTKIWATDDVIAGLKGRFAAYDRFQDVPRTHRAAPDAKTWAAVQLWQWWLPPSSFSVRGGGDDDRVVCTSRTTTIWTVMLSAYKSSDVLDVLPDLEPELWEHIFTFLKHDQQPCV